MTTQKTNNEIIEFEFRQDIKIHTIYKALRSALKKKDQEHKEKLEQQKERLISKLKEIDADKWDDACHCTCLGYAISILTDDKEYHPKNYKCEEL